MRDVPSALGVLLGLALVVYGAASLTGGWLGAPPWWERSAPLDDLPRGQPVIGGPYTRPAQPPEYVRANDAVGAGLIAAGLLVAGVAAWPRRR